jgi:hypothetical protein
LAQKLFSLLWLQLLSCDHDDGEFIIVETDRRLGLLCAHRAQANPSRYVWKVRPALQCPKAAAPAWTSNQ